MKQKITVRALVRENGKTLLLKRASGREAILHKFELPGGEVLPGEQPEDALRRLVRMNTGIEIETLQLSDVLNFSDTEAGVYDLVILYLASVRVVNITLNTEKYSKFRWQKMSDMHQNELTDTTVTLLKMQSTEQAYAMGLPIAADVVIYSDGGSRGNPGPSAAGYVIYDSHENLLDEGGSYLGITTNNQAEYQAVYLGLLKAGQFTSGTVEFRIDSLLVVNQMKGIYQIKNRDLWPIHEKINELKKKFKKVNFVHVKREFNQYADSIVNRTLDERARL
ncbi:MAG TPA: reverse transcriptase-like protein [Verrucomicrobiae bacterium]|nr:reverse transcriptase-like protein [Verrucomicrobiae bacterium]